LITCSKEVLKRIIRPIREVPKKIINAPILVIKAATPSQAFVPNTPAFVKLAIETKKRRIPTITFGWLRGPFNFETKKEKERKIKGRKTTVQEK